MEVSEVMGVPPVIIQVDEHFTKIFGDLWIETPEQTAPIKSCNHRISRVGAATFSGIIGYQVPLPA